MLDTVVPMTYKNSQEVGMAKRFIKFDRLWFLNFVDINTREISLYWTGECGNWNVLFLTSRFVLQNVNLVLCVLDKSWHGFSKIINLFESFWKQQKTKISIALSYIVIIIYIFMIISILYNPVELTEAHERAWPAWTYTDCFFYLLLDCKNTFGKTKIITFTSSSQNKQTQMDTGTYSQV